MESVGSSPGASHAQIAYEEDLETRTNFDFTPYRRPTVGFDRLYDLLGTGLCGDGLDGHPPFDIARDGGDSYRIAVAVAGFRPDDIDVVAQQYQLTITGKRAEDKGRGEYLYRGIAARPFERRFQLADFIKVRSQFRKRPAHDRSATGRSRSDGAAQDRDRRRLDCPGKLGGAGGKGDGSGVTGRARRRYTAARSVIRRSASPDRFCGPHVI